MHNSVVYFIASDEAVKIGRASNLTKRLGCLQVGNHKPLTVLGSFKGGEKLERELHKKFHKYRIRGEWFQISEEILSYIEKGYHSKEFEQTIHNDMSFYHHRIKIDNFFESLKNIDKPFSVSDVEIMFWLERELKEYRVISLLNIRKYLISKGLIDSSKHLSVGRFSKNSFMTNLLCNEKALEECKEIYKIDSRRNFLREICIDPSNFPT